MLCLYCGEPEDKDQGVEVSLVKAVVVAHAPSELSLVGGLNPCLSLSMISCFSRRAGKRGLKLRDIAIE